MMVVGSTIDDVMTVQPPTPGELKKLQSEAAAGIHEKTMCRAFLWEASLVPCLHGNEASEKWVFHYHTIPEVWLQCFHRSQIWFVWLQWAALWAISELAPPVALTGVRLPWHLVSQEGSIGCRYTTHTTNPYLPPSLTHTHTHTHTSAPPKEALSEQKEHKKLIEKGKPEDVPPGIKHRKVGNWGPCTETSRPV